MTTLNLQVGNAADDCLDTENYGFALNGFDDESLLFVGHHSDPGDLWSGFRFRNVTIPAGSTINSATMQLYTNGDSDGSTWRFKIVGEDQDNPGVWADTSHEPSGITETTAKIDWDPSTWASGWHTSPDISTIIQEIIDRGGWSSGNAICLVVRNDTSSGDNNVEVHDYYAYNSYGAKLDIDYTAPAAGVSIPVVMHHLRQQGIS
jgi:hypothetical protein